MAGFISFHTKSKTFGLYQWSHHVIFYLMTWPSWLLLYICVLVFFFVSISHLLTPIKSIEFGTSIFHRFRKNIVLSSVFNVFFSFSPYHFASYSQWTCIGNLESFFLLFYNKNNSFLYANFETSFQSSS